MAGFERKKLYKLVFKDSDLEGLEVVTKSTSMAIFLKISKWAGVNIGLPELDELLGYFSQCLVSWNFEEDGVPVPATEEEVRKQDPDFVLEIVNAWVEAMSPAAPLGKPSQDGGQSLEESIPMEALSPSLAS